MPLWHNIVVSFLLTMLSPLTSQTTRTAGYLTGPVGAAGYLTAGPANIISDTPPPLNTSVNEGQRSRPDAL